MCRFDDWLETYERLSLRHTAEPPRVPGMGGGLMVGAPRTKAEVMRAANAPLTTVERIVLDRCRKAAAAGEKAPSIEELSRDIGANGIATVPGIMKRLEAKGYITRQIFQRGRIVCVVATGQCTAPPNDTSPHWRRRAEQPPTPTIQAVRERNKPVAVMIEAEARQMGKHHSDFLADLVYIGWHAYQAEKETE